MAPSNAVAPAVNSPLAPQMLLPLLFYSLRDPPIPLLLLLTASLAPSSPASTVVISLQGRSNTVAPVLTASLASTALFLLLLTASLAPQMLLPLLLAASVTLQYCCSCG